MVECSGSVKGMALNLESNNVDVVLFGSDTAINEGDNDRIGQLTMVKLWLCRCWVEWSNCDYGERGCWCHMQQQKS